MRNEIGWQPAVDFEGGMAQTIDWYLANQDWLDSVIDGSYQDYYQKMYS